ncbi:hypothetical protein E2C01_046459 [Portunus trituberculatus]|uniref:Uncharacterized protein n=1 Tax=Portunus trituberculatus TaxID=210409 RepID=A0A5B7G624_PORTR|nr:hypothetical protein [Portunus trituberculatus]
MTITDSSLRIVRREEESNFEKDVVQKSADEPKLFYKFINGEMNKETIETIIKGGKAYQTAKEMNDNE